MTFSHRLAVAFAVVALYSPVIWGQGFYERNVQRNPITGRLEVVGPTSPYGLTPGANRDYGSFYGQRFNPYSGTSTESRVQRDPVTGRMNVDNRYYNPWTGAEVQTATRFNPFTQRYETLRIVTPPHRPIPDDARPAENASDNGGGRTRPRVIESAPPPTTLPPPPDGQGN